MCCWGAQYYHAEVFIFDDPGPPLDTAKLHYCYSLAVSAAYSAPVLLCLPGTPLSLLLWLCRGLLLVGALRFFWPSPLPSLRCMTSGA